MCKFRAFSEFYLYSYHFVADAVAEKYEETQDESEYDEDDVKAHVVVGVEGGGSKGKAAECQANAPEESLQHVASRGHDHHVSA